MDTVAHLRTLHQHISEMVAALPALEGEMMRRLIAVCDSQALVAPPYGAHASLGSSLCAVARAPQVQEIMERLVDYFTFCHTLPAADLAAVEYPLCLMYNAYLFALAELLGHLPLTEMLPGMRACLGNVGAQQQPLSLVSKWQQWALCSRAEPRLDQALDHDFVGTVLVNNVVLVKVVPGRLAGVALYCTPTRTGFLLPGVWYAPTDENLRETLRETFFQGKTRLTLHELSSWVIIRGVQPTEGNLVHWLQAKRSALTQIPAVLTSGTVRDRRDVYQARNESFS